MNTTLCAEGRFTDEILRFPWWLDDGDAATLAPTGLMEHKNSQAPTIFRSPMGATAPPTSQSPTLSPTSTLSPTAHPPPCDESIQAWLVVASLCALARALLSVAHLFTIQHKKAKRARKHRPSTYRSAATAPPPSPATPFPSVKTLRNFTSTSTFSVSSSPSSFCCRCQQLTRRALARVLCELMAGVLQMVWIACLAADMASARNGLSQLLFGLCIVPIACGQVMDLRVIHLLGRRMVPFSSKPSASSSPSSPLPPPSRPTSKEARASGDDGEDEDTQSHRRRCGFSLSAYESALAVAVLAVFACQVCLLVLSPVLAPSEHTLRAAMAFLAVYVLAMGATSAWQLHACFRAIMRNSVRPDEFMLRAARKFRALLALTVAFALYGTTLLLVIACGALAISWPVLMGGLLLPELASQSAMVMVMFPVHAVKRKHQHLQQQQPQQTARMSSKPPPPPSPAQEPERTATPPPPPRPASTPAALQLT